MTKRMSLAITLAVLLLIPTVLFAQMGGMKGDRMHCAKGLDLTAEQKVKMEKLKLEHKLAGVDVRAEQAALRLEMKKEMMKEEPSRKALEKYAKSLAANREKMQMMRIDHLLDVRKVLNAEQWKIFVEHHYDRKGRMGERGCRSGMRGGRDHKCHDRMMGGKMMGDRDGRMMKRRDGSCLEMKTEEEETE